MAGKLLGDAAGIGEVVQFDGHRPERFPMRTPMTTRISSRTPPTLWTVMVFGMLRAGRYCGRALRGRRCCVCSSRGEAFSPKIGVGVLIGPPEVGGGGDGPGFRRRDMTPAWPGIAAGRGLPVAFRPGFCCHAAMTVSTPQPPGSDRDDEADGLTPRQVLLVVLVLAVLLVGGWFLSIKVADDARFQDCVMAGRHNCAPIDTGER